MNSAAPVLVVTRPESPGTAELDGVRLYWLPLLALATATRTPELQAELDAAARSECLVFVSAQAVRSAWALKPDLCAAGQRCIAVGARTAAALRTCFACDVRTPAGEQEHSEGVLELLGEVAGSTICIVAAPGGRTLLQDSLSARGARVQVLHVYARQALLPDAATLAELRTLVPAAYSVTSVAVLDALVDTLAALDQTPGQTTVVTSAERIAAVAQARGFGRVLRAAGAQAEQLVAALRASRG